MLLSVFVADLLIPMALILWLWFERDRRMVDWLLRVGICGAVVLLRFMLGMWPALSYALRYVLVVLFCVAAFRSYWRVKGQPFWHESRGGLWLTSIGIGILGILAFYNVEAIQGYRYGDESVNLVFPLRAGTYYITEGGSHPLLNGHLATDFTMYAVDIEALNVWGRYSWKVSGQELTDYEIYGAVVYSPCAGKVIEVMNVIPDSPVDQIHLASANMNRVVLQCDDARVLMGHLLQGSVNVAKGDQVEIGQPLGKVGNSGKSYRPHLHIQASGRNGSGVPILFDNDFPVRNDVVVQP